MDPPRGGTTIDPARGRLMTVEEKRELVRELSKCPESAPDKLQSWTRRQIVEILCADLGRERKYTGLSKQRMLDYLFRVVSGKTSGPVDRVQEKEPVPEPNTSNHRSPAKRSRKSDNPSRLTFVAINSHSLAADVTGPTHGASFCQNLACRATLNPEDKFCRRCSCCICFNYDDNKDPSLWLFCSSDQPFQKDSCLFSCHLECALKDERAGILQSGQHKKLDGAYYCTRCWKQNNLLGSWKKQLVIAKDARRLDVLCHRIFLSHKILASSEKYLSLHEIVDTALKKLEDEVGAISGTPNIGRGIVSRLAAGAEVQKLCAQAIDAMESMFCGVSPVNSQMQRPVASDFIKFEAVTQASVTVFLDLDKCPVLTEQVTCFNLWHRVATTESYPSTPTGIILSPSNTFPVTGLVPATSYIFKVVAYNKSIELGSWEVKMKTSCQKEDPRGLKPVSAVLEQNTGSPKTNSEGHSDPSSEGVDSNNNTAVYADLNKSPESDFEYCENPELLDSDKAYHHPGERMDDLQNIQLGAARLAEVTELEEAPGLSASALDEEPNPITQTVPLRQSPNSVEHNQITVAPGSHDASNAPVGNGSITVPPRYSGSVPPTAPRGTEYYKESNGRSFKGQPGDNIVPNGSPKPEREPGNSSNKRTGKLNDISRKDWCPEASFEYCVKVVRWLECEGYIETNFRMKFLSWFSLRATPHERKIVSVYVDTLIDDPVSLSAQLVDSFTDAIHSKKRSSMHSGFCMDLWH